MFRAANRAVEWLVAKQNRYKTAAKNNVTSLNFIQWNGLF